MHSSETPFVTGEMFVRTDFMGKTKILNKPLRMTKYADQIRAAISGPFPFQDLHMEKRYRQYFIRSILDRTGRVMCVWLPFVGIMRLIWLIHWVVYPFDIATVDLVIFFIRLFFLVLGTLLFAWRWGDANKSRIGLANLWIARTYVLVVALGESAAERRDPQKLASLVAYLCICGLFIPSFTEYLLGALPVSFVRPAILNLLSREAQEQAKEVVFQHTLILLLGISITWTAHADCRRDWLRARSAPRVRRRPTTVPNESQTYTKNTVGESPSQSRWGDVPDDGYFSRDDRAEVFAEAQQVVHLPYCNANPTGIADSAHPPT